MKFLRSLIFTIDSGTAYTRKWAWYSKVIDGLIEYGIPLLICIFLLLIVLRFLISSEKGSFFKNIFHVVNIKEFVGEKMDQDEANKKMKRERQLERREARMRDSYQRHGMRKKGL